MSDAAESVGEIVTPLSGLAAKAEHLDVLVIGAGVSGIAAGHYLQTHCPEKSYAILESRDAIGGTWDLFRYPGLRSDSDLYTFGFSFRPWTGEKAIADGASILAYLRETATAEGIDRKIRFRHRVVAADWDGGRNLWTVDLEIGDERRRRRITCGFLSVCAGYYDYEGGHRPELPGAERFAGRMVHPQDWPADLDHSDKHVVVVGSGATAVTLVPEMAKTAAHVTMLQRSPTYVISLPARDRLASAFRRRLPSRVAHGLARWKNILLSIGFFQYARRRPEQTRRGILSGIRKQLGPDYDVGRHFSPRYKPWDQRVCFVPNGDLFEAIRSGRASVSTDEIRSFTADGIELASGERLDADIVVTATGLRLKMLGGMKLTVDGRTVDPADTYLYKGLMLSGVPNLSVAIGYTNASWTLKCELTARYVCRLLRRMDRRGEAWCMPRRSGGEGETPAIDFSSGYIERGRHLLPKQGKRKPWRLHQNYILDLLLLRWGRLDDGALAFGRSAPVAEAASGR